MSEGTEMIQALNISALDTIIRRHKEVEGFCQCCTQPWPCDIRIVGGLIFMVGE